MEQDLGRIVVEPVDVLGEDRLQVVGQVDRPDPAEAQAAAVAQHPGQGGDRKARDDHVLSGRLDGLAVGEVDPPDLAALGLEPADFPARPDASSQAQDPRPDLLEETACPALPDGIPLLVVEGRDFLAELDPARRPVRGHLIGGDAPDLLGVPFEEHPAQGLADLGPHVLLVALRAGFALDVRGLQFGQDPVLELAGVAGDALPGKGIIPVGLEILPLHVLAPEIALEEESAELLLPEAGEVLVRGVEDVGACVDEEIPPPPGLAEAADAPVLLEDLHVPAALEELPGADQPDRARAQDECPLPVLSHDGAPAAGGGLPRAPGSPSACSDRTRPRGGCRPSSGRLHPGRSSRNQSADNG